MASIDVDIDIDDYLDEATTEALVAELKYREKKKNPYKTDGLPWGPAEMADDLRKAFYAKDANQFEFLLSILDRLRADVLIKDKPLLPFKKEAP